MSSPLNRAGLRALRAGCVSRILRPKTLWLSAGLVIIILLITIGGLLQGSLPIPASDIGGSLFYPQTLTTAQHYVVWEVRLPRLLMAILCGSMLGLAGAAMQSVTRNGLADPGLIGVKEGCCVVVLAIMLLFPALSLVWRPLAGVFGGCLVAGLVMLLARDISRPRFVLIGIGVSWFFAAGIGLFITTADVRQVQTALIWMSGSLHAATWPLFFVALIWLLPAAGLLLFSTRAADIALLGNQAATGLGIRLARLSLAQVIASVFLTAASVSCVGSLGFVGLMAPHMARFWLRGGQMAMLSGSALLGALLVLITDTIGRVAFAPLQIPAGIVIALVGGPFFLLLLWRRRNCL